MQRTKQSLRMLEMIQQQLNKVRHPCDKCGVMVPEDEYTGHDKPDGTSEYLCADCPSDYENE